MEDGRPSRGDPALAFEGGGGQSPRRLIVNADDFGRSHTINEAVQRAHENGILTTSSLMVNEPATEEAVAMARRMPRLGVGLHLTLLCGHSALPPSQIPGLVNAQGAFGDGPVSAGFRYFARKELVSQLRAELGEQFARFKTTGLKLDHVNGHLHLHLHPTIFRILMENAAAWGITHLRWTRDPFWLNMRLASGHLLYRGVHAALYQLLSARSREDFRQRGIKHTTTVFGLLQNERVDEDYLLKLLPVLPPGDTEVYSHPSTDVYRNELDGLLSPRVRESVERLGIRLIRYQDL